MPIILKPKRTNKHNGFINSDTVLIGNKMINEMQAKESENLNLSWLKMMMVTILS